MPQPLVVISHLDFAYPGASAHTLRHIDLTVESGSTLGIIGPNGGGKTTLLKLLLGVIEPSAGSIRVAGMSPRHALRRGDVLGYVPQNPQIPLDFPIDARALAQLGLVGKTGMLRSRSRDDLAFVDHLLERVGIADCADAPIGRLSGGQLQRALFARALAPRPKLLLLDEPTTGIDRAAQQKFIELLQQLKSELGLTVALVSHDLRAVTSVADRIACLNVTLHYHDVPNRIPAELAYRMFSCDLAAMGIAGDVHVCCDEHDPARVTAIPG